MKLFIQDGYKIEISEEAYAIKAFRVLWNRDRSEKKLTSYLELCYVFFMCDPRSDFSVYVNEDERHAQVVLNCGFKDNWQPDNAVKEAMKVYAQLSETQLTRILDASKYAIELVTKELRNIDFSAVDAQLKPVYKIETVLNSLNKVPIVMRTLVDAEKIVKEELERSKMEAGRAKTIGEDGFDNF